MSCALSTGTSLSTPSTCPPTEAAEAAAAQGRFWQMHDLLFENQEALAEEDLRRYARELGLDLARFEEDLAKHRYAAPVEEDVRSGERSGVEGTPTFFINGVRHEGSHDLEPLLATVEKATSAGPEEPALTMSEAITRGRSSFSAPSILHPHCWPWAATKDNLTESFVQAVYGIAADVL